MVTARRERAIRHVTRLLRASFPRVQMAGLLVLTSIAGLVSSVVLLALGVESMAIRYPIAVLLAYGVFLLSLRSWLSHRLHGHTSPFDGYDVIDVATHTSPQAEPLPVGFGGGRFGGGGAGGSFDGATPAPCPNVALAETPASRGSSLGGPLAEAVGDALWPLALVIGLVLGVLLAACSILYVAPALLAEILLDGLIAAGLLRRLRGVDPQHWTTVALRRSWIPVAGLAGLLAVGGWVATLIVPGADSIGDVFRA